MKRPKGWTPTTTYQLGDNVPYNHPIKKRVKGMNVWKSIDFAPTPANGYCARAVWTKEYREPKKGEWYISGCEGFVRAYLAPNDLGMEYFVCQLALVKTKTKLMMDVIEVF